MIWTDERVDQLKALYADTHVQWSSSQMAAKLGGGLSRNAVIGKLHRLGLARPPKWANKGNGLAGKRASLGIGVAVQKINAAVQKINSKATPKVKPEPFVVASADVVPLNRTFEELQESDCRFAFGDGPFLFCGHPKTAGSSYCAPHKRLCCAGVPQRRGGVSPLEFGKSKGGVFGRVA